MTEADWSAVLGQAMARVDPVDPKVLARVVRKRLSKFVALLPGVFAGEDPEAVHDLRVWSRRLQQALVMFFAKPRPGKVRRLRRSLRRVRGALGEWRNCDVQLELVGRECRRTRSQARRRAWSLFREYLFEKRARQVAAARRDLLKHDLAGFAANTKELSEGVLEEGPPEGLTEPLRASLEAARARWQSSLAQAQQTRQAVDIHQFRIATKRLRYRIELMHDLGNKEARPLLGYLKEVQEALGRWHDRQAFYQALAEAVARPEFLVRESNAARTLLVELAKSGARQLTSLEDIFCKVSARGAQAGSVAVLDVDSRTRET